MKIETIYSDFKEISLKTVKNSNRMSPLFAKNHESTVLRNKVYKGYEHVCMQELKSL